MKREALLHENKIIFTVFRQLFPEYSIKWTYAINSYTNKYYKMPPNFLNIFHSKDLMIYIFPFSVWAGAAVPRVARRGAAGVGRPDAAVASRALATWIKMAEQCSFSSIEASALKLKKIKKNISPDNSDDSKRWGECQRINCQCTFMELKSALEITG